MVSSRADAGGLARAEAAGLPALASADEAETLEFLERHGVGARRARRLHAHPVAGLRRAGTRGRILNVHPSLLPAFPGATAVRDALAHGVRVTGVTVHLVDDDHVTADIGPDRAAGGAARFV